MSKLRNRGFTLIELIIFIVVVGLAMAGILAVSNTVVKSSADPQVRKQGLAIAQSLLEEILLKQYAKPADSTVQGFSVGGARNFYDCVLDYSGYTTSSGIVDATGNAVGGLNGYNIAPAVTVTNTTLGTVAAYRIDVSVTGPQGDVISLTGYRGNY
jgi:MSHA pilin protein MshD